MEIKRKASLSSGEGLAEYLTGMVRVDPLFRAPHPGRAMGASVTFEPGARTAWHTHPLGQTLIVTSGLGWAQCWEVQLRKSGLATWSGFHRVRSIGMGQRPRPQ